MEYEIFTGGPRTIDFGVTVVDNDDPVIHMFYDHIIFYCFNE